MEGIVPHAYFDPINTVYVVVGHSVDLRGVMDDNLHSEIGRGLWWFMLTLIGGLAIVFVVFLCFFERSLQRKVTKPI